jgi:ABC-type transporter MlaC component
MSNAMSISVVPASSVPNLASYPASSKSSATAISASASAAKTAAQQFQQYASMTPAQRLHAQMLAKLGLTEDQFKAMSPADQQKVEDKIRDMIKQQLADNNDKRTGLITDKTA